MPFKEKKKRKKTISKTTNKYEYINCLIPDIINF